MTYISDSITIIFDFGMKIGTRARLGLSYVPLLDRNESLKYH